MVLAYNSDLGYAGQGSVGLIVLSTDQTLEMELGPYLRKAGLAHYISRIKVADDITPQTLKAMGDLIPSSAELLDPEAQIKAIGYGCTSASCFLGSDYVAARVHEAHPDIAVCDPISSVMAACEHLGVKRIAMLTPYRLDVTTQMRKVLENNDFSVSYVETFDQMKDAKVARISESSVLNAVCDIGAGDCDAVFISCTNLRSFSIIEEAEKRLGKPVLSSNSAFLWAVLKAMDVPIPIGPGQLFSS